MKRDNAIVVYMYNTARIRKRLQESRGWKRKVGWTKRSESIEDEKKDRARNAMSFMYKYLHLSSKKEVRSAVIGPLRRPSFASFFALLSGAASILRAHPFRC